MPDIDESELRAMQSAELKRMFLKVDKQNTGTVDKDQFEILVMALGVPMTPFEVNDCFVDLGIPEGQGIPFDLFADWWISDVGAALRVKK